ncbi:phosphoglucosamine mutase [Porphyromonas canoris]|uniref:phosphoglucosamine mutase n=1 Tax=Porphyromonas canoris TaxID=36875 RepID=UPI00051DC826|nr:phosphoglucosamine mutase [Porphyromonas canoris]KGL52417.1 phosphoglucosamine mutase [Porphyromonas canoris]
MSLIKSISGIRGTIGGSVEEGLNPVNIAKFTAAYASLIRESSTVRSNKIVVGRDARISGPMVKNIVTGTLVAMGFNVVDIDLASTPTTEMAVIYEQADGGIIITASHNPKHWNALKLLNEKGEFLSDKEGKALIALAESDALNFSPVDEIGRIYRKDYTQKHIDDVVALPQVDVDAISRARLKVAVDCVNSVGAVIVPSLLEALGVRDILLIHGTPNGEFAHDPEPLPHNLTDISSVVVEEQAHVGFAVDPDADRLAVICEDGSMFGEENTLIAVADYLLDITPGQHTTVSNLSSSRGLRDVTLARGGQYYPANVGEVNVVAKMKEVGALIGGEGNGGVIFPALHYGRDAMVGIALFLTALAKRMLKPTQMREILPQYCMFKTKVQIDDCTDFSAMISKIRSHYPQATPTTTDGLKLDFETTWVQIRKSNTEPIVRIYSEAPTMKEAEAIAEEVKALFLKGDA